jgi:hypothetical protein
MNMLSGNSTIKAELKLQEMQLALALADLEATDVATVHTKVMIDKPAEGEF